MSLSVGEILLPVYTGRATGLVLFVILPLFTIKLMAAGVKRFSPFYVGDGFILVRRCTSFVAGKRSKTDVFLISSLRGSFSNILLLHFFSGDTVACHLLSLYLQVTQHHPRSI